MPRLTLMLAAATAVMMASCKPPLHLGYDYGRAYVETLRVQADLTRPSVQYAGYSLYGIEAVLIRLNVEQATTDQEDSESEITGMSGSSGGSGGGGGGGGGQ